MTVRPLMSFDLGPVGLWKRQSLSLSPFRRSPPVFHSPGNHGLFFVLSLLECGLSRDEWFRSPVLDKLIDLL